MKKLLVFILTALILNATAATQADDGFYLGAQGGLNFLNLKSSPARHCTFDTGYNLGAAGGYAWCNGLRLESEATYRDNAYRLHGHDINGSSHFRGDVHTWSFMVNGYYDFPGCWCFAPYIGAGIGCDWFRQKLKIGGEHYRWSKKGFSWQLMAGLNYTVCEEIDLSAEYKFHMTPVRHSHQDLQNHSITFGVKKFFGCY